MSKTVIFTDSGCDMEKDLLDRMSVKLIPFTFRFNDEDKDYFDNEMPRSEFYSEMKKGRTAKTAAISIGKFKEEFERELKSGNDVIYVSFSSGMSSTINAARIAATELSAEYPSQNIAALDSLCGSSGQTLLIYFIKEKLDSGMPFEEVLAYAEKIKHRICHWFTVDDLKYLKAGGRISTTSCIIGSALGIKPILHLDEDGRITKVSTVRGRKNSIEALVSKYEEFADKSEKIICVCHANCPDDAQALAKIMKERYGLDSLFTLEIGPVIGCHSGPGTLALFFLSDVR